MHDDPARCITRIKKIFPAGPAAQSGQLRQGDVILEVDGQKCKGLSRQETLMLLRTVSQDVKLLLCRPPGGTLPELATLMLDERDEHLETSQENRPASTVSSAAHSRGRRSQSGYSDSDEDAQEIVEALDLKRHGDRTPENVKSFLADAGLASDGSPARSPSAEFSGPPEEPLKPGEYDVTLTKGDKGLGFTVAGGQSTTGYFYVKDVLYEPAVSNGNIRSGDRLKMVNGWDMTGMNHKEAIMFLRDTPVTVTLRFHRPASQDEQRALSDPPHSPVKKDQEADQNMPQSSVKAMVKSLEGTKRNVIGPYDYRGGAARSQQPGDGENGDEDEEQEADEDDLEVSRHLRTSAGRLNDDADGLLSTMSSFGGSSLPILDDQEDEHRPRHGNTSTTPISEGGIMKVELQRPQDGSLGFSLIQGEKGVSSALYICTVTEHGAAGLDGTIRVGDKLLQVNGESVIGMPHNKAVALIKNAHGPVQLTLKRASPHTSGVKHAPHSAARGSAVGSARSTPPSGGRRSAGSARSTPQERRHGVTHGDQNTGTRRQINYDTDSDVDSTTLDEDAAPRRHVHHVTTPRSSHDPSDTRTRGSGSQRSTPVESQALRRTPKSTRESADEDEDEEDNPNTFDSLEELEAYEKFVHRKNTPPARKGGSGGSGGYHNAVHADDHDDDEEDDSWALRSSRVNGTQRNTADEGMQRPRTPPIKPPRKSQTSRLPSNVSNAWLHSLPLVVPPGGSVHYTGSQLQATLRELMTRVDQDDPIEEYKSLRHAKLTDNCLESRREENKPKNRFRNVLPYDANRVKLTGPEDYINASHVHYAVGNERLHYIACQGPLPHTTGDYWRMIWEQQVEVVAMVTRDIEDTKTKCHRYWPDSIGMPFTEWNRFEVSLTQVHHLEGFDVHYIKMEDLQTGSSRRVTHLNFTAWPDHGSPDSGLALLRYVAFLHLVHGAGPIVVHCSAGIGRTGALITIDIVLAMIAKDLTFDIQKIVQDLRRQRQGMIQTKDQYSFCYTAVLDALRSLMKAR